MVRKILAALALATALGASPVSADEGLVELEATVSELSVEAEATVSEESLEFQLDGEINIAWDAF
jgi:hypothetical protein